MKSDEMLRELARLAERLGVEVRFEPLALPLESKGGLCTLRGAHLLVVDERLALEEKIGVLAEAMGRFDLEQLYIPPAVRARVGKRNTPTGPLPRPLARAKHRPHLRPVRLEVLVDEPDGPDAPDASEGPRDNAE